MRISLSDIFLCIENIKHESPLVAKFKGQMNKQVRLSFFFKRDFHEKNHPYP